MEKIDKKVVIIASIIIAVLLLILFVRPFVIKIIDSQHPIVGIQASNENTYTRYASDSSDSLKSEINESDFVIEYIRDNGKTVTADSSEFEFSNMKIPKIGDTATVTITSKTYPDYTCTCDIHVSREAVKSYYCGTPNLEDVTVTMYSNGELAFEGEGDVATFSTFPWDEYKESIMAVSFEDGVTPTNMNEWFADYPYLEYIERIPTSVKTMTATFKGCTSLKEAPEWSDCEELIGVNSTYKDCTALETTPSTLPPNVRNTAYTFANCTKISSTPDMSSAEKLTYTNGMFYGCEKLVNVIMPPAVKDMTSMFEGCLNLTEMPTLPSTVTNLNRTFANCENLSVMSAVPVNVDDMTEAFYGCKMACGDLEINCNTANYDNIFYEAAYFDQLNLIGSSEYLNEYALENQNSNITVNDQKAAIPEEEETTVAASISQ